MINQNETIVFSKQNPSKTIDICETKNSSTGLKIKLNLNGDSNDAQLSKDLNRDVRGSSELFLRSGIFGKKKIMRDVAPEAIAEDQTSDYFRRAIKPCLLNGIKSKMTTDESDKWMDALQIFAMHQGSAMNMLQCAIFGALTGDRRYFIKSDSTHKSIQFYSSKDGIHIIETIKKSSVFRNPGHFNEHAFINNDYEKPLRTAGTVSGTGHYLISLTDDVINISVKKASVFFNGEVKRAIDTRSIMKTILDTIAFFFKNIMETLKGEIGSKQIIYGIAENFIGDSETTREWEDEEDARLRMQ